LCDCIIYILYDILPQWPGQYTGYGVLIPGYIRIVATVGFETIRPRRGYLLLRGASSSYSVCV